MRGLVLEVQFYFIAEKKNEEKIELLWLLIFFYSLSAEYNIELLRNCACVYVFTYINIQLCVCNIYTDTYIRRDKLYMRACMYVGV